MSDTSKKQRRQRAVLSCNDCRRRKLKCDRELPCNRCKNGGIADSCAYSPEAHGVTDPQEQPVKRQRQSLTRQAASIIQGEPQSHGNVRETLDCSDKAQSDILPKHRIEQLQFQVALLKEQISIQRHPVEDQTLGCAQFPDQGASKPAPLMGLLKGRNYATFFHGSSSAISIMAHFSDLRSFMKDIYQNSTAQRLQRDMKAFEDRAQPMSRSYRVLSVTSLRSLLPDRATVGALIRQYLDTFETTYRVLHIPSFEAAYQGFWNSERSGDVEMDALVLAILACTLCTSTHDSPRYNHNGSTFHTKAVIWIKACEAWLKRHSNKHRTLISLQVRCLRILALSTTSHKKKEYYQDVQAHIAFMRSSGLHRDPSIFGTRCSAYEGEMRRRLWATSMELELQASIDKGLPSVISSLEYDCTSPRNINDADLPVDLTELPNSHPITTFTDTSYLHLSMRTIDRRTRFCSLVNSFKASLSFQDILRHTEDIQRCLQATPKWGDSRSLQARTLLDLQLRQFLVILHTSKVLGVDLQLGAEGRYSMIAALEASAALIDLHTHVLNASVFTLCCTRNDYYRAALLICHIAYHASKSNHTVIAQVAKLTFNQCLHQALRLQEERAMRPGRGSQQHWYLSAAMGLVGLQFDPSQSEAMKLQAIDRVSRLLYKTLSLLDDPDEQSLASEVYLDDTSATGMLVDASSSTTAEPLLAEGFTNAGLRFDAFDLGSTSEWMLDDFWFFNDVSSLGFDDQHISGL
ncbi:uncharacterized protein K460DRAFT_270862 [Cucurbitaria berberidis CBS 394.84]|uniref:Zn(2)-C6 fungal-type domain-containing protein n=1 Tax=Cucurbitaria berberidis CBS 394.84 TaxID=1168544 RepID=A0A9P4GQT9_9PLEO|nr:uncharacterized protein K460DRAFT_270862 [Cucurbitaria berberidis CBS 394.84]KAF1851013.1 hypothetical protein K460DRAFT_270862 [Cucurbitaria berberidis CBS 394.84]